MPTTHFDLGLLVPLLLALIGGVWGIRLWIKPQIYNPESILYRQLYLWYTGWFGKKVDETYSLNDKEIRRSAILLIVVAIITSILAVLAILLSQ
jgi:hypothetical protein